MKLENTTLRRIACSLILGAIVGVGTIMSQPLPPPGGPGSLPPAGQNPPPPPNSQTPTPPPGQLPPPSPQTPPPPAGWGCPGCLSTPPAGDWMNQGTLNVMATGYDSESVLVQIPLVVSYSFNGVNYDVTVLNAWSPYTQSWVMGLDTPAYQTSYFFNGFNYNYYASLPSGTYYFNL